MAGSKALLKDGFVVVQHFEDPRLNQRKKEVWAEPASLREAKGSGKDFQAVPFPPLGFRA